MHNKTGLAILGAGNIGTSIALGLIDSGQFNTDLITLTRRKIKTLARFKKMGFPVTSDNRAAVQDAEVIIIAVEPQQFDHLLDDIAAALDPARHLVISVVTGVNIARIKGQIDPKIAVVRAMPNTAISVGQSMTCLCSDQTRSPEIRTATSIFEAVGRVMVISEEQMFAATALGACGIAFFLRAIRAASQGGIEIGFHADEAIAIATQTAKGAVSLLLGERNHPEYEIDKVTTPRGCTISGLNQMEHAGFSSALIQGIVTSSKKAEKLY